MTKYNLKPEPSPEKNLKLGIIKFVALSPSEDFLLSGGEDTTVRLWALK